MVTVKYKQRNICLENSFIFLFLISLILTFISPLYAHEPLKTVPLTDEEKEWLNRHETIVLGAPTMVEPYVIIAPDGTVRGVIIEYIDLLNKKLGSNFSIRAGQWSELVEKSKGLEIDGLFGVVPEYASSLGLLGSETISTVYPVIYTLKDAAFQNLSDLKGKRVAIKKASYFSKEFLKPYINDIEIIETQDGLKALEMVFEKKADVMIGLTYENFLVTKYHLPGIIPAYTVWDYPVPMVLGIRSDWNELLPIINKGIRSISEYELNGIISKWYNLPAKPSGIELDKSEKEFLKTLSTIKISIDPNWAPIEYIDKSGNPSGIVVDFLKKVESKLDIPFKIVPGDSWNELLSRADKGEVDLFPSMVRTSDREKQFEFTAPYISFPIVIFAKKETHYIADLKELRQKRVAVIKGHAIDEWLTKDQPEIDLLRAASLKEAMDALGSGSVDAYVGNILPAGTFISNRGYSGRISVVGETQYSYDLCLAVRKNMASLIPILQKAVKTIPDAEINEIRKKWISIGYEYGSDYSMIWKGAAGVTIIIIVILLWNRYLALEVDKRTKALELNKQVITNTSIGTTVFRASGECIMANEAASHLVGGSVDAMLKLNFYKIKDWPANGLLAMAQKALKTETVQTGEITTITTFGKSVYLYCRLIPFSFKKEQHLILMFEDISERKRVEEALKSSEEKYRLIAENASDVIFTLDKDLNYTYISPSIERLRGYTPEEAMKYKATDFLTASSQEIINKAFKEEFITKKEVTADIQSSRKIELEVKTKDGKLIWIEVAISLIYDDNNNPIGVIGNSREITSRKKAEEELKNSEEKFSRAFLSSPDMITITNVETGKIIDVSDGFERITGYSRDEALGKTSEELGIFKNHEYQDRIIPEFERNGTIQDTEVNIFTRSGKTLTCLLSIKTIEIYGQPHFLTVARDITDRKQMEQALAKRMVALTRPMDDPEGISFDDLFDREEIQKLQDQFAAATGVASIITDTSGKPVTRPSNFCRLCFDIIRKTEKGLKNCYKSDATIGILNPDGPTIQPCLSGGLWDAGAAISVGGKHIANWLIGQVRDETQTDDNMRAYAREIGADEDAVVAAFHEVTPMSHEKFQVISETLFTLASQISSSAYQNVQQARFISDKKRADEEKEKLEAQLLQTQKMESLGVLAGGIAHDFNNILSSIFGYTELSKMGIEMGENVSENLEQVLNAATRAKNLVKHILTFSRQTDIQKTPTAVRPLIHETLKFIRSSLPTTIEINHDLGARELVVMADPTQIHQIVMNLCTNAAHAMKDKGGILDIRLSEVEIADEATVQYKEIKKGRYLRLTVADTGTGIKDSVIDHIFDPFYTTKERGEGTGLGLSVIHGIVKDLEGAISVYSEVGRGSTFQILLPEYEGEVREKALEQQSLSKGEGRILFVDDEKGIIESGERILDSLGYDVISTTSSIDALEIFKAHPDNFDLVLTDMTMPKMTGLELSKKLLEIRKDIPIILCTGYSLGLSETIIRKNGIRKMIMKPIIINDLAVAINETLSNKEKKSE